MFFAFIWMFFFLPFGGLLPPTLFCFLLFCSLCNCRQYFYFTMIRISAGQHNFSASFCNSKGRQYASATASRTQNTASTYVSTPKTNTRATDIHSSVPSYKLFVGGQFVESKATKFFDVYNPVCFFHVFDCVL